MGKFDYFVVSCSRCSTYQATRKTKSKKFNCKKCGSKESIRKKYAVSNKPSDLRPVIQCFNCSLGRIEEQEGGDLKRRGRIENQKRGEDRSCFRKKEYGKKDIGSSWNGFVVQEDESESDDDEHSIVGNGFIDERKVSRKKRKGKRKRKPNLRKRRRKEDKQLELPNKVAQKRRKISYGDTIDPGRESNERRRKKRKRIKPHIQSDSEVFQLCNVDSNQQNTLSAKRGVKKIRKTKKKNVDVSQGDSDMLKMLIRDSIKRNNDVNERMEGKPKLGTTEVARELRPKIERNFKKASFKKVKKTENVHKKSLWGNFVVNKKDEGSEEEENSIF